MEHHTHSDGRTESEYPAPVILGDPGDEITGEVVGFSEGPSKFSPDPITIVNLRRDDGVVLALWLNSTVLQNKVARLRPKVGELLEVEYLGKRQGANAEYKDYRVAVPDRQPFEPDWSSIGGEVEEPEPSIEASPTSSRCGLVERWRVAGTRCRSRPVPRGLRSSGDTCRPGDRLTVTGTSWTPTSASGGAASPIRSRHRDRPWKRSDRRRLRRTRSRRVGRADVWRLAPHRRGRHPEGSSSLLRPTLGKGRTRTGYGPKDTRSMFAVTVASSSLHRRFTQAASRIDGSRVRWTCGRSHRSPMRSVACSGLIAPEW